MKPLEFKIDRQQGILWVLWTNGAGRPASEVEAALWQQLKEQEAAKAELLAFLHKQLQPVATKFFTLTGKALADLPPEAVPAKMPPTTSETKPATTATTAAKPAEAAKPTLIFTKRAEGSTSKVAEPAKPVALVAEAKPTEAPAEKPAGGMGMSEERKAELRARFARLKAERDSAAETGKDAANGQHAPKLPG